MGNLTNLKQKDKEILTNLYQNKEGLRVLTLMKLTNLKRRNLYKRLNYLESLGLLENIYPIWKIIQGQVEKCSLLLKDNNIFELHNLSYVVPIIKTPDWWNKRARKLMKIKGFQFKNISWGNNIYQQLINENYVIQTYPESIIIICRKRYYSNNPYEVIIQAMNEFLDFWTWFEERMKFKFFIDGIPQIKLRNNDFNRIKDYLAEHCKKEDKGFLVQTSIGNVWVDYSEPFGKEANTPDIQYLLETHTKDIILNKPLLPSQVCQISTETAQGLKILVDVVSKVTENQENQSKEIGSFAVALNRHIPVYESLAKEVKELKEIIKQLKESLDKK